MKALRYMSRTQLVRGRRRVLAVLMLALSVGVEAALGGGINRTIVTPILHTGDPAPGIDGATAVWVGKPQIDAGGAVSFEGFIAGDGVDASNNLVLWYGPPGGLAVAAREGDQVPGLPPGVIYDDWEVTYTMGEDGTLSIGAILIGPGVIPNVNDKALLVGPAGDLQMMIRAGDPAPGMAPGVAITTEGNYAAVMADDGRFMTRFHFAGPGIDETNDEAYWAADATEWHLIVRTGDPAPGTEPGVTFMWIDGAKFNNSLSIAFRGGLTGDTVDFDNNTGYWSGPPGDVQIVAREGDPAPGLGDGIFITGSGNLPTFNASGDFGLFFSLIGEGVTPENNHGLWVGLPGDLRLLARANDPVPGLPDSVRYEFATGIIVNAARQATYAARFRGEVEDARDRAVLSGPFDAPKIVLREGDPVPGLEPDTVFDDRLFHFGATNDHGDMIEAAGLAGENVDEANEIVFLLRDHRTGVWYSILREGDAFEEHILAMDVIQDALSLFWESTGGSDGLRKSLNDAAQFVGKLTFADGSLGNYLFELPALGDFDEDGDVDVLDYEAFLGCVTGPAGTEIPPDCDAFDIDWDGDIDRADFGLFQLLFTVDE